MSSDVRPPQDGALPAAESSPAVNTLTLGVPMSMPAILINPRAPPASTAYRNNNNTANRALLPSSRKPIAIEGKRRLLRSAHFRALTTGPGASKPTGQDYMQPAKPNAVRSTFPQPMPPEVARALKLSREEQMEMVRSASAGAALADATTGNNASASSNPGQFEVSLREARRFLKERLSIIVRADQAAFLSQRKVEPETATQVDAGPAAVEDHAMQRFADIVEEELDIWLTTEVYVRPDQNSQIRTIVAADFVRPRPATASDNPQAEAEADVEYNSRPGRSEGSNRAQDAEPCVLEISSAPHSLRWHVPSPLLRYAVHCLARIHGCPSFSKDAPAQSSNLPGSGAARRETWILNPNPAARGVRSRVNAASRRSGVVHAIPISTAQSRNGAVGLDTPPTTDIGTDIGTDSEAGIYESSSEAEHHATAAAGTTGLNTLDRSLLDSVVWSESEDERVGAGAIDGAVDDDSSSDRVNADDDSAHELSLAGDETITRPSQLHPQARLPPRSGGRNHRPPPLSTSVHSLASCEADYERESEEDDDDYYDDDDEEEEEGTGTDEVDIDSMAGSVLEIGGDGDANLASGNTANNRSVSPASVQQ
ncbi:hypothetical protein A4X09_0g714 [Tilletia walkeri]|uniref:Uncharacterized protein n=1 Tax=Tilletia walkeri TaxID=117179 RepID=A0A8X7T860_9BASI|nr:hypothetical protein A4X09_0g714 [Tilletia walkeri]